MAYDPDREWPFLARDAELALLLEAIHAGADEPARPAGVVIVAPAGVGKTRLAREAADRARAQGIPVRQVIGTRSARRAPYAAVAHLAPGLSPSDHPDAPALFGAVAEALPADPHRPLVVVDDAQLLDEGSAALLLHLALTGAVTVIATVRRGTEVPDAVTALWKEGLATRLDMQPFSTAEIERLIGAGLGGDVTAGTAHRLAEIAGGNPLYARELVRSAVQAGALSRSDAVWSWDGTLVLADRLVDAVGARLHDLSAADRIVLSRLAIGEPLALPLALATTDAGTLARLEATGLVRIGDDGCRLEHPLFGEVLLAELGTLGRREACRALAAAAETLDAPSDQDVLRRVGWALDGGDVPEPADLVRAARIALDSFDAARAETLALAALGEACADDAAGDAAESGGGGVADDDVTVVARVVLAVALNRQARFAEAEPHLMRVEPALIAHPDAALRRLWLDACVVAIHQGLGRADELERLLERVEAAAEHRPADRRLARAMRGNPLVDAGRLADAVDLTAGVLAEAAGPDYASVVAASSLGEAQAYLGLTSSARRSHRELFTLCEAGVPEARKAGDYAVLQEVMCRLLDGRADSAAAVVEPIYRQLVTARDDTIVGLAAMVLGQARLMQGRAADARRALREAVDCLRRTDLDGALPWALSMVAQAEALLGDLPAAREAREESTALHRSPIPARSRFDAVMARVRVEAAEGNATGAARTALAAASGSEAGLDEFVVYRARLLHLAARLGENPAPLAGLLAELAGRVEGESVALMADHVAALAAGDGAGLARAAERFAERGQRLEAADAADAAARAHAAAGSRLEAARLEARRERFVAECGPLPGLGSRGRRLPDALSRREREVAALAAEGLTTPQIAGRLVLSTRTVESHLYRAFAKLGVQRRDELAEVLGAASDDGLR